MKSKILSLIFILAALACASSPSPAKADCTIQTFTTPNSDHTVQPGDCILRAQASSFGYIRFSLPTEPTLGDTYIFQENGAYQTENYEYFDDETQEMVYGSWSYTGGLGVLSLTDALIDDAREYWLVAPGYQVTVTFDGTNWISSVSTFTP